MNSPTDKEIKALVNKDMLKMNDNQFADTVAERYLINERQRDFGLFWNVELLAILACILTGLSSFVGLSLVFPINLDISYESIGIITITLFIFLIFRFFSEYLQTKSIQSAVSRRG